MFSNKLLNIYKSLIQKQSLRFINSNTANITRLHRTIYARQYPTVVVLPDGSSIRIRYSEPRKIIKVKINDISEYCEIY